MLRAWRYRDSLKEGAPLRPWLYRVATNACLDAIARDERRAVLAAKVAADDGAAGKLDDVVWLRPIPDSQLEPPTPPPSTPEAITLTRETIEIAFLTVIQLLTPQANSSCFRGSGSSRRRAHTRHPDRRRRDWRAPGRRWRRRGGLVWRARRAAHRRPAARARARPRAGLARARARAVATPHRLRHHADALSASRAPWNGMHLSSGAEFNLPRTPPQAT
jgi:Sigma-70 region 2